MCLQNFHIINFSEKTYWKTGSSVKSNTKLLFLPLQIHQKKVKSETTAGQQDSYTRLSPRVTQEKDNGSQCDFLTTTSQKFIKCVDTA